MSRSLKKGPYIDEKLLEKVLNLRKDQRTIIKTWARSSSISPEMVGHTFGVHNGKEFVPVFVSEDKKNQQKENLIYYKKVLIFQFLMQKKKKYNKKFKI